MEAPSAISLVRSTDLNRTAGLSLVAAFNTAPGVRMEERSPGSYRLSVRGSLLRSPFGVRNVKIYWDDIPLTDASGNTYLNLIAPSAINSAEIIKGPGASLYGAGTGGVVLFHTSEFDPCLNLQRDYITPDSAENQINDQFSKLNKISSAASVKFGSYGLWSVDALAQIIGKGKNETQQRDKSGQPINLRLSATGYDGYRRHSEMKRKTIQLDGTIHVGRKSVWKGLFTYVDLFYQTPGGLTAAQYEEDPKQARPATAQAPGAAEQNASITNRTVFAGTSHRYSFNNYWKLVSSVVGSFTDFANPFITNYEIRKEYNSGLRTSVIYDQQKPVNSWQWQTGIEYLFNSSSISNYGNRQGIKDTLQASDKIRIHHYFPFSQLTWQPVSKLFLQAGLSMNSFYYQYKRLSDPGTENESRQIPSEWMPRFAAGYKMKNNWQVYVNVSKGFSPPTLAEIRPSTNEFNNDLQSEYGWNYEAGTKMSLINNRLYIDYSAFYFRMKNAIVRRLNSGGAEYFVNAGGTKQPGMELFSSWKWSSGENRKLVPSGKIWLSLTSNRFKFSDYVSGTENYNGNALTGVPQHVVTGGADLEIFKQFTAYISHNYTGKLPLNDANDEFAAPYHLLHVKSEYKIIRTRSELLIFAGIDNLLDVKYSLGNDINAFGRRFYNTAAGINFYAGFSISLN